MALNSTTLIVPASGPSEDMSKEQLLNRHQQAIEKVINDAKDFKKDRKRILDQIGDTRVQESEAR